MQWIHKNRWLSGHLRELVDKRYFSTKACPAQDPAWMLRLKIVVPIYANRGQACSLGVASLWHKGPGALDIFVSTRVLCCHITACTYWYCWCYYYSIISLIMITTIKLLRSSETESSLTLKAPGLFPKWLLKIPQPGHSLWWAVKHEN